MLSLIIKILIKFILLAVRIGKYKAIFFLSMAQKYFYHWESNGQCLSGLEVKLTALPDNTTYYLDEAHYGSEIVRIVYL